MCGALLAVGINLKVLREPLASAACGDAAEVSPVLGAWYLRKRLTTKVASALRCSGVKAKGCEGSGMKLGPSCFKTERKRGTQGKDMQARQRN